MKRIAMTLAAAILMCSVAVAQEEQQKKRKHKQGHSQKVHPMHPFRGRFFPAPESLPI